VVSRHLHGYSPHLCRLRTDGLAFVSKYWTYWSHAGDMGPVSLVVGWSTKAWLFPTAPLSIVGEKLGTDPWIGRPACWGLCREPFFLGAVDLFKSVDDCIKGCYMWIAWDTYGHRPYADWVWKACGVLVGFSPVGCTSIRIAATLGYE
jgi:hypothetical protein